MQAFIYDENGFFKTSEFVDELGENMTTKPILIGRVKPKFDTKLNEWIEGATNEEIKEWEGKQPKPQLTEIKFLKSDIDFQNMIIQEQQSELDYLKMTIGG